ncbi:MAG: Threonine-tRNA ligase, partial [Parcubacteria group bacterium GW2011_GWB1_42_6]
MKSNLETLRHSISHLLAAAVLEIFPDAKLAIGPAIENGFYYDFDLPRALAPEDLQEIEKKIKQLAKKNLKFEREDLDAEDAKKLFEKSGQIYKVELIEDLQKDGAKTVSIYKTGNFTDLCAGPHIESTGQIKPDSFKLLKLAGAYWRGDEKNKMLQRIYGAAFETKEELESYLKNIEEAEKRNHRKLGKELELFMISEDVGKGLPLWLPKGAFIRKKIEDYMYAKELERDYKYVYTPVLTNKKLYETSGHLAHYRDDMYNPIDIEGE